MTRQILTQADGPLYESLLPADKLDATQLRKLHEIATRLFDSVMVRFDDAVVSTRYIDAVTSPEKFEGVVKTLTRNGEHSGFDIHVGPSAWPHGAFQEIAEIISEAPHGSVIGPVTGVLGVYYLMCELKQHDRFRISKPHAENGKDMSAGYSRISSNACVGEKSFGTAISNRTRRRWHSLQPVCTR
jgi:hypothetical protein